MKGNSIARHSHLSNIILIASGTATLINVFYTNFLEPLFMLDENQLLYLFSAMAQIIGGVFGLTLTAYVFFVDKFKESAKNDETYYDATVVLLNRYFRILILITFTCGVTIVMCVAGIVSLHSWNKVYIFIINESVSFFLIGVFSILVFGMLLLDPKKLDKEIAKMKKRVEEHYQAADSKVSGDFRDFLKTYNMLERLIIEFATECVKGQEKYYRNYKPQIIQSLKILSVSGIINDKLLNEINEFRIYRNGLVHGVDFDVTQDACNRISEIYNALEDSFQVFKKFGLDAEEFKRENRNLKELNNLWR